MHAAGTTTDTITVANHLAETGDLGKVGGVPYLHTLIADVPSTANAGHYAGIVADHRKRRKVAEVGAQLVQLATTSTDAADLVATGRALLDEAGTPGGWAPLIPLGRGRHLPPFPAELFPDWLAEQVFAVAEFTQTPIDLAGSLALACLSAAAGERAEVEVRGSWREPTNLYTVSCCHPARGKARFSRRWLPRSSLLKSP
jgi:replicative DNA helicase